MRPAVAGNEGKDRIGRTGDSGGTATPGRQLAVAPFDRPQSSSASRRNLGRRPADAR
jgi:hypothetical protein